MASMDNVGNIIGNSVGTTFESRPSGICGGNLGICALKNTLALGYGLLCVSHPKAGYHGHLRIMA